MLRVHDASRCDADGTPSPVENAVVEIWHCDAGGSVLKVSSTAAGYRGLLNLGIAAAT